MSDNETLHGLTCPQCGGVVPIPEGQAIVRCPYCNLRSLVRGERGLLRYQVPLGITRQNAVDALQRFFSNMAIARDAKRSSSLSEAFVVFLPFWAIWGRVASWIFGQKKVGSGDNSHYEPREVRLVQETIWNGAACDVGEFGVNQVPLTDQELEPFNPETLHNNGLVFEPVGSFSDAQAAAEHTFQEQVRQKANLDRISQLFVRFFRRRAGLVYYPLWVVRYLYRGRAFQVVVDGHNGKVLYGKAPGNTLYRAAVLVLGMALGAFLGIDISSLILFSSGSGHNSDNTAIFGLIVAVIGFGLMYAAYRRFRYGEQYEYRSGPKPNLSGSIPGIDNPLEMVRNLKDVEQWINKLN